MRASKIETREEFNSAVEFVQMLAERGPDAEGQRNAFVDDQLKRIVEYAQANGIDLFIGGVLAENRPVVEPEKVKPRKIYIAGPMTGIPDFNRKAFNDMAAILRSRGHIVLNPAILPDGLEQHEYMDVTIAMLRCSDTVCLLEGWTGSDGAKAEAALAKKLKIEVRPEFMWRIWE